MIEAWCSKCRGMTIHTKIKHKRYNYSCNICGKKSIVYLEELKK